MNFLRWLSFGPVAITSGITTSGLILIFGDLLLGHWWLTGCLVIAASAFFQPVVATQLAVVIAPRVNKFTAWVILLPFAIPTFCGVFTIFALIFLGYEGDQLDNCHFNAVSPWWCSFSACLGWLYGFSGAWTLWGDFLEQQQLYDECVEAQLLEATSSPLGGAAEAA